MSCCCSNLCAGMREEFTAALAESDLKRYRRSGPNRTTRMLRDGVVAAGGAGSLLDVGAGIGALSQELLSRGFARATLVDASPAYQAVARRAASEPGLVDRMEFREGDFVDLAPQLAQADAVVLDRVVCCYPDWQPLLEAALAHGRRIVAFSYPRDRWIVRFVVRADNQLRRLTRRAFRSFVHPEAAMSALPAASGFRRASRGTTFVWNADVYVRENG